MTSENVSVVYINQTWVWGYVSPPVYLNFTVYFIMRPWGMDKALPDYLEPAKKDITSGFLRSTDEELWSPGSVCRNDQVTAVGDKSIWWPVLTVTGKKNNLLTTPPKDQMEKDRGLEGEGNHRVPLYLVPCQRWMDPVGFLFAKGLGKKMLGCLAAGDAVHWERNLIALCSVEVRCLWASKANTEILKPLLCKLPGLAGSNMSLRFQNSPRK